MPPAPLSDLKPLSLRGKMVEVHGKPNIGKTAYVLNLCEIFQKSQNCVCYYVDADCKLTKDTLARKHSLDMQRCFLQSGMGDIISLMPSLREIADVVVVDSMSMFKNAPMNLLLSRLSRAVKEHGLTVIVTNQVRADFYNPRRQIRPYYENLVQKYCDVIIDLDTFMFSKSITAVHKPMLAQVREVMVSGLKRN